LSRKRDWEKRKWEREGDYISGVKKQLNAWNIFCSTNNMKSPCYAPCWMAITY
jgi:hypothetical protein